MRRIAVITLALALFAACSSDATSSFVVERLAQKASKQAGPKTLLATGKAPNGLPYILDAYRLDDGRICLEHAWEFRNGSGSQAECTPDNNPRTTFQNWSTYPGHDDSPRDETPWLVGIVLDSGKAVTLRGRRGNQTQEFRLIRSDAYRGNAFYIGRTQIPELFEQVELLDAKGNVIMSAPYNQGVS